MVRYRYNEQVQPSAPFIYIGIAAPNESPAIEQVPALIDTGADITVIPR